MTDSTETVTVPLPGVRGTMRLIAECSTITPETKLQSGLLPEGYGPGEGPRRLFFGAQTEPESFELIEAIRAGYSGPFDIQEQQVEVSGYLKYAQNAYGYTYLDERALFVEKLTLLS